MLKKPFKIAHIHVWDKKNKGDVGIVQAVQQLLRKNTDKKIFFTDLPIETLKRHRASELAMINRCDAVVIGGGGIFYHYFLPFDLAAIKAIKVPLVIYGAGYIRETGATKLNQEQKNSLLKLADRADLIGVRDYYTKHYLKKIGVHKNISLVGDPAIFLKEIPSKFYPDEAGLKIGFNLNYSGWLGFGRWQKDILDAYEKTAEYFIKRHGAKIYYLVHHPDEAKIAAKLKISGLELIDFAAGEQKYFYGRLNLVIGMMLHSCVMAFGAGTPEINLAYDLRNSSFAKFISSPELLVRPNHLKNGELLRTAKHIIKQESAYRKKFSKIKKRIWLKQEKFISNINALLNE